MLEATAVENLKLRLFIAQTIERLEHENFEQGEWQISRAATRSFRFRARYPGQHGDKDRPVHHGVQGRQRITHLLELGQAAGRVKQAGSDGLDVLLSCFHAHKSYHLHSSYESY